MTAAYCVRTPMKKFLWIFMAGVAFGSLVSSLVALRILPRYQFTSAQCSDASGTVTVLYRTDLWTGATARTFGASTWHPVRER